MPSKYVDQLMKEVSELRVSVAQLSTDMEALKKLVYLGVGVGTTAAGGILVQLVVSMFK